MQGLAKGLTTTHEGRVRMPASTVPKQKYPFQIKNITLVLSALERVSSVKSVYNIYGFMLIGNIKNCANKNNSKE